MDPNENPYLTPTSNPVITNSGLPGATTSIYGPYRDARGLAKIAIMMLALCGLSSVMLGVVNAVYYTVLDVPEATLDIDKATTVETAMLWVGIFMILVYIGSVITFCMWTNRAMKNTWAISQNSSLITPGWAVGWYFIPIALLWKPVGAVQQMRDAVFGAGRGLSLAPWWTFWLLTSFTGRISMKMPTETIADLKASALFDTVTSPIDILSAVFAILMVKKLTNKQHEVATGEV